MRPFWSVLAVFGLVAAVTACQSKTETKENLLSSSGFKALPPTTPARMALLKSLPPHKLAKTTYKGEPTWVYADPTICGCLYIGNQDANNVYVKKAAQAKATQEKEERDAQMALDSIPNIEAPGP
jgi:hypothetical protein